MDADVVIHNGRLVIPRQGIVEASLAIKDGRISAIFQGALHDWRAREVVDAGGKYVLPGAVESHMHIGHSGPHAKEFGTETASAAIGGVTTILTFFRKHPYNYHELVPHLIADGEANARVDFGIHLVLFTEDNLARIPQYVREYGILSFKFFPGIKGEDAAIMTALPHTGPMLPIDDGFLMEGLRTVGQIPGAVAQVHAENAEINSRATEKLKQAGRNDFLAWCESRPAEGEAEAASRAIYLAKQTNCPLYLVHMSSEAALSQIRRLRNGGAPVYAESCAQYLTHTKESPVGALGKMSPPLRTAQDNQAIWDALADGTVQVMATDHGAFKCHEKLTGDIWHASSGFAGVATLVPVLLSEGVNKDRISLERVVEVTSYNPARIFGIYPRKGTIAVGSDADLAIVDMDWERKVTTDMLSSGSDFSIYEGWKLRGWPVRTLVRGRTVMEDGKVVGSPGYGKYLRRAAD